MISADVTQALGHYVYAYIDPRDDSVFYIGKGSGARATAHLGDVSDSLKVERIRQIRIDGFEPRIDIIAYGLRDQQEACRVEAALIELIGVANLTNIVRGQHSTEYPRRSLLDFIQEHAAETVDVIDPALLIRVNREFRYGMSAVELYEITRGIWVIGEERRKRARCALTVFEGIVREVYEIESWHRAASTPYETRDQAELATAGKTRWEFIGHIAPEPLRTRYLGRSVAHLFKHGQQSPIMGIGLD